MSRIDALLLLMTVIWGTNYAIVKSAFSEIDPQAFDAVRLAIAAAVFLATMAVVRWVRPRANRRGLTSIFRTPAPLAGRDWLGVLGLAVVGHATYQYCFIGGLARTSVANSSLIIAATPVLVGVMSAALGQDRLTRRHWIGTAISVLGIYVVVGRGVRLAGDSRAGDLLIAGAVTCWAAYTIGARQLMQRHSPVGVTGLSMSLGVLLYVPAVWPHIAATHWATISARTWGIAVYSALFALCVSYTIWYSAVRAIGGSRTAVYSNVVPVVAMATAAVWLREPLSGGKILGAAAVLLGVALTRSGRARVAAAPEP